jgi:hypothetical protein
MLEGTMKHKSHLILFLLIFSVAWLTQVAAAEVRKSLHASVTQRLGEDTDVTFEYSRPGVKDRKIWGDLVPYGMYPGNKYSDNKPYPWRAGANENTTIQVSADVMIEGKKLAAGTYGVHMIASENDWVLIFSKKNAEWGSFSYDEKEDALRITVKAAKASHQEWLLYGFDNLTASSATAFLHWEKVKVPFKIEIAE